MMRCLLSIWVVFAGFLSPGLTQPVQDSVVSADLMRAHLVQRPELDQLHWKDPARGGALKVRILHADEKTVTVQKTLVSGLVVRSIPLSELSGVGFVLTPVEQGLLRDPSASAVPALQVMWKARRTTLDLGASNVADTGMALAKGLWKSREVSSLEEAASLLDFLLGKESLDHRKQVVMRERQTLEMVRALVLGPPEETDRIAWKVTEFDGNPEAMLLATAWLADRHLADLKRLEAEHPRWDEDEDVRPLRMRFYHLSLDFALYPSLFHGSCREAASEGLKKAWEVYRHVQSDNLARQTLEDLAALYPESQAARETAAEWERLKMQASAASESQAVKDSEGGEDGAAEDGQQKGLPKVPPPPKRYNLFDE